MILVPIESAYCEFLLVSHNKLVSRLHRFWDMATYWLKIANFLTPLLFGAPHEETSHGAILQ